MKILHKLTLSVVGIALMVPVVGVISINAGQRALEKSAIESTTVLSARVLGQAEQTIVSEVQWFRELSGVPIVQQIVDESNRRFDEMDDPSAFIAEEDKKWVSTRREEITPFMQEIFSNAVSERLRRKMAFSESEYSFKMYGEIFITNKYGANVAQTGKTSDYNQADEKWWQMARRDGLYISDVEYDDSSGVYAIDICVRTDDADGRFAGVMKAVMNIDGAIRLIKNADTATGHDITMTLLDANKLVLYPHDYSAHDANEVHRSISCDTADCGEARGHYFIKHGNVPGEGDTLVAHAHSAKSAEYGSMGWTLILERDMDAVLAPMAALRSYVLTASFTVMIAAVALGTGIARRITGQLSTLAEAASRIGSGRFDTQIERYSNDEIGQLAESLNKMASNLKTTTTSLDTLNMEVAERQRTEEDLAQANKRMLQTARNAGKAEVASAVLHNVGNAINSVNVIAGTIKNRLSRLKLGNLTKAAAMLEQHRGDLGEFLTKDERGSKLPLYLVTLSGELAAEQRYMLEKMEALNGQIRHTAEIINIQQSQSKSRGLIESAPIPDLIEDAIRINSAAIEQHSIEIVRKYADLPNIETDRSRVVQILVNLIGNSVYAVLASDNRRKAITLSVRSMTDEFVQIEVTDNGIGISRENAAHLFEYGFTTKKKGHGFGLHGGAVSAKEMGGKLTALSRGTGKGATFILELPVRCPKPVEVEA